MVGDGLPEGLTLESIFLAGIQASSNQARGSGSHRVAPLFQSEHGNFESFSLLTQEICQRNPHVIHREEAGIAGPDSPLLFQCSAGNSRRATLHDKRAEPAMVSILFSLQVGPAEDKKVVGNIGQGNPDLLPV